MYYLLEYNIKDMKITYSKLHSFDVPYIIPLIIPFEYLIPRSICVIILLIVSTYVFIKYHPLTINKFFFMIFLFSLYGVTSIIYTKDASSTYTISKEFFLVLLPCLAYSNFIDNTNDKEKNVILSIKLFVFSTLICTIICWIIDTRNGYIWFRLGESLFNMKGTLTYFSYYLICCSTGLSLLITIEKSIVKKIFYIAMNVFIISSTYLTAVRKGIILIVFFNLIYVLLLVFKRKNIVKTTIKIFIVFIFVLIFSYIIYINLDQTSLVFRRFINLYNEIFGGSLDNADSSLITRMNLRMSAIRCFTEYPLIGYGFGAFRNYAYKTIGISLYAHNNYLELLASTGIIGFILYYSAFIVLIRKIFSKMKNQNLLKWGLAFIIMRLLGDYGEVSYLSLSYMFFLTIISNLYYNSKIKKGDLR